MARIALIKVFPGLNMPVAQLSGTLLRAGHACEVFFFKESVHRKEKALKGYRLPDVPMRYGTITPKGLAYHYSHCYTPVTDAELALLAAELKRFAPDAIGMSVLSTDFSTNAQVADFLRRRFGLPILWGGYGPTFEPERAMAHADLVCIGEGEGVILEVAARLDTGASLAGIPGTWCRQPDGSVERAPQRPLSDLDAIAFANWDPETYRYIHGDQVQTGVGPNLAAPPGYFIMTQRGCPFSCSFCGETRYQDMFGKKQVLRRRSPEHVLAELREAKARYGFGYLAFGDPIFTINPRWLKEFLPRYRQEIGVPFWCWTYPTTHNPEILALLRDNGCISITMGVQSGSDHILRDVFSRPTRLQRVTEAGQEIVDAGIQGSFDLIPITGFETERDLRDTFEFLLDFPRALTLQMINEMIYLPTYDITRKHAEAEALGSTRLPQVLYDYYVRLFFLTRENLPRAEMLRIAADPAYRQHPQGLEHYLHGKSLLQRLDDQHGDCSAVAGEAGASTGG